MTIRKVREKRPDLFGWTMIDVEITSVSPDIAKHMSQAIASRYAADIVTPIVRGQ